MEEGLELRPWTGLGFGRLTGEVDKERFEVAGVSESESSSDMVAFDLKFDDLEDLRRIGVFFFSAGFALDFTIAGVRISSSSSEVSRTLACFFSFKFSGVLSLVGEEGRGDGGGGDERGERAAGHGRPVLTRAEGEGRGNPGEGRGSPPGDGAMYGLGDGVGSLGEGVGLVLRSDMLPTLGLFLVALIISPRPKPSSFLSASSSDSDGLSDSLSDELSELELAPGLDVILGSGLAGFEAATKGKLGA